MLKNQHGKFLAPRRRLSSPRRGRALRGWGAARRVAAAWPALLAGLAVAACQPRPPICPPGGAATPVCPPCPACPEPSPTPVPTATPAPTPEPDRIELRESAFADLPGWSEDAAAEALPALRRSCESWGARPPGSPVGRQGMAGTVADWGPLCAGVAALPAGDSAAVRALLERETRPVAVTNRGEPQGLFTGYYEPTLRGSRTRGGAYLVPLYLRPPELVQVELGDFRDDLAGKRIAGEVRDGRLVPFHDRAAIEEGALAGRGLELVWVDDPVDAFFLQIQGSGLIELAEGGTLRAGYAAQNGHPYLAIGRELVARGAMPLERVSMQSIAAWLRAHPQEAVEVMRKNASYVFFRELDETGPLGSMGVVLTPGRSLAVDPLFIPMGAPLWLDTTFPLEPSAAPRPLRRLLVAQDTGGAIQGPVRGDVFWGPGEEAAELAGRMRQEGRLWLLLPTSVPLPQP